MGNAEPRGLVHTAFVYETDDEFTKATSDFVERGLAAGHPVFVALAAPKVKVLRQRLGADSDAVAFSEMDELGRNPSRIIPALRSFIDGQGGRPITAVGEIIWAERSTQALREAERNEALINLAFADADLELVCFYDSGRLGSDVIKGAWTTHPLVDHRGSLRRSPTYGDPHDIAALDEPLPGPPKQAVAIPLGSGSFSLLRALVRREATDAGLTYHRAEDFAAAAHEIAVNFLRHGGQPNGSALGTLRVWQEPDGLVCELAGPGHISDPLVGRRPPTRSQESGRGLWMVNQLCDLVQLRSGQTGTVVRLHMRV